MGGSEPVKLIWEELEILLWKQNRDRNSPSCAIKKPLQKNLKNLLSASTHCFTEGFPAEVRLKAVKNNSWWTDSGSDLMFCERCD